MCWDKPLHEIFGFEPNSKDAFSKDLLQHKHVTVTGTARFCVVLLFLVLDVVFLGVSILLHGCHDYNVTFVCLVNDTE